MSEVKTKTVSISHANIEAALADFLYKMGNREEIVMIDLGLPLGPDGLVEMEVSYVEPSE